MTLYTKRIAYLAPVEHAAACNRAANALGRPGDNFNVRLSASGEEPATHIGGCAVETGLFMAAVAAAPELPEGMPWPEGLDPADWQAVADHLGHHTAPVTAVSPPVLFAALLADRGLRRIQAAGH